MAIGRGRIATPLARPVDLSAAWNASDAELGERLDPRTGPPWRGCPTAPSCSGASRSSSDDGLRDGAGCSSMTS